MGDGQVPDVNVVPDAGAVPGRPVGPGDLERHAFVVGLDYLAQGVGRAPQLQAGPHLGVGPDGVEIAQGQHPDGLGGGDVGEHRLAYRLGPRVRALRVDSGILVDAEVLADLVDGG